MLARARKSLAPIAEALRKAKIPFRAVELEQLQDRAEIIDALALARALFNPHDRVAWLSVLRAPWCGLSLADLHALVSADDPDLLARPVPELIAERKRLLSVEAQPAAERVLSALELAGRLRSTQPTAALGTWLEQVWLSLGGAHCVDAMARANLDLLWRTLDKFSHDEPDLLGPALDAALKNLKAQPDPAADSDCGVQLMTIHGAKGLEFEIVIVPELQAPPGRAKNEMLSWMERGLPPQSGASEPDGSGQITEFLIAPFSPKGSDPGKLKRWVNGQRSERERQEAQRLLYVAATRAREELHFFARPEYKTEKDGKETLAEPAESLLKTAWPAFEEEIKSRFDKWRAAEALAEKGQVENSEETIGSIAASSEENLVAMPLPNEPPPVKPAILRRLPPGFRPQPAGSSVTAAEEPLVGAGRLYERHEGGLQSRALGKAVHLLFQQLAPLLAAGPRDAALAALAQQQPRIASAVRAAGIEPQQAGRIAAQALQIVLKAAAGPQAQWILAPHPDAANEVRWTGVVSGSLRTVQVDRVFRDGPAPQTAAASASEDTWWIIDYKTAHEDSLDPTASLPELRRIFAPQIEAYAEVLRKLRGNGINLCGGLYYPRMSMFDWWQL